jgi:glycosyltransferase involved in cell wall biosynthesis
MTASAIAVVLHDFASGGSERIAIRLANHWAGMGRHVALICGEAAGPLRDLVASAVTVTEAGATIRRGPGSRKRMATALAAWADRERPDVLFFPGNYHIPIADVLARRAPAARPVLVAKLSNPLKRPDRSALRPFLFDRVMARRLKRFDGLVSMAPALTPDILRLAGPQTVTEIAEPTLADDLSPPAPADDASRHILAAGRLVPQKNFSLALKAFAALPLADATLTILGDGPERPQLLSLARTLSIEDRLNLPGHVPDIGPWLDDARLFLLSSVFEGYPAVVVESLARGRPVATTDSSPALRELLPTPEHGLIAATEGELSSAMLALLQRKPPDPMMLADSVGHHQISAVSKAYLSLFDALAVSA